MRDSHLFVRFLSHNGSSLSIVWMKVVQQGEAVFSYKKCERSGVWTALRESSYDGIGYERFLLSVLIAKADVRIYNKFSD